MHRILIVDDQRDVRVMLRTGLQTLGHEMSIVDVPSGEEALLVISGQPFDLLIIDVRLPGISGFELKQRALILNPKLKLVLITGLTDFEIRDQVAACGADAFFWKPIPMAEFLGTVDELLGYAPTTSSVRVEVGSKEQAALDPLQQFLQDTGSQSALIFDAHQLVISRSGEMPLLDEPDLLKALTITLQAGEAISRPLGGVDLIQIHYLQAPGCDLFLAPISSGRFFLATTQNRGQSLWVGEMIQAIQDFLPRLKTMETDLAPPVREAVSASSIEPSEWVSAPTLSAEDVFPQPSAPAVESDEPLPSLHDLFGEAADRPSGQDADAFWDDLINPNEAAARPGSISYEQAQGLGLTPDEK
jgi:CheY-like chemotaxis protein